MFRVQSATPHFSLGLRPERAVVVHRNGSLSKGGRARDGLWQSSRHIQRLASATYNHGHIRIDSGLIVRRQVLGGVLSKEHSKAAQP